MGKPSIITPSSICAITLVIDTKHDSLRTEMRHNFAILILNNDGDVIYLTVKLGIRRILIDKLSPYYIYNKLTKAIAVTLLTHIRYTDKTFLIYLPSQIQLVL